MGVFGGKPLGLRGILRLQDLYMDSAIEIVRGHFEFGFEVERCGMAARFGER
jgi:hypothetical protein